MCGWSIDWQIQNRIIASKLCKLIDDRVKSLYLQCKTESRDGMADLLKLEM